MEFEAVIRGIEVTVHADNFDGPDPSSYGPEEVWAEDENGEDFPLTDDEIAEWTAKAAEAYYEDD